MIKQLLSLATVAMVASSAQALDLTLTDLGSGWGSSYDADTKTITYEGDWSGRGWWLGDVDYSAYTDIEIEVEALSIQAKIVCEYNNDIASSESSMFDLGATVLNLKLSEDGKASTKQIYIQCGSLTDAPTITLVSAKLVDNSGKAPDLVIFEGDQAVDWWSNAVNLTPANFEYLEDGDALAIDYNITGENGSIKIVQVYADWSNDVLPAFAAVDGYNAEYGTVYLGSAGASGTFDLPMPAESVEIVKNPSNQQTKICGDGVNITKVEIVKATSSIADVLAAPADGVMYNIMGMPVDNGYKGLVIKNGKKFYNR